MPRRRNDEDELITESDVEYFERARREWKAPSPPPEAEAVGVLNRFVELQHAAAAAADAASRRARDRNFCARLEALSRGQAILARELSHVVRQFGGAPPDPEESREQLPADHVVFAYIRDDRTLACAVVEDLRFLEHAYKRAAGQERLLPDVRHRLTELATIQNQAATEIETSY